jgi:DNA-binding transcriptional ArsR family regulator
MVQYSKTAGEAPGRSALERSFAALADPTRLAILQRLERGEATITELAEPFGISLTGLKKHVQVLEEAGLVTTEKVGRTRYCRASPQPRGLEDARTWIDNYQRSLEQRLDRFGEMLERQGKTNKNTKGKS